MFRRCIVAKVILETIAGEENIARLLPRSFPIANVNYTLASPIILFTEPRCLAVSRDLKALLLSTRL